MGEAVLTTGPVLTPNDLHQLTGYKLGSAQRRWFRDQLGFEPPTGRDGRPRITWDALNAAIADKRRRAGEAVVSVASGGPNWRRAA